MLTNAGRLLVRCHLEGPAHIEADCLELGDSLGPHLVEEGAKGGGTLARLDPDDPTLAVVVGHDGQVATTLSIGDLVDPEASQSLEATLVEHVSHVVDDGLGDRLPTHAQQLGDGGLIGALGSPPFLKRSDCADLFFPISACLLTSDPVLGIITNSA